MISERRLESPAGSLNIASVGDQGSAILLLHGVIRSWHDFASVIPSLSASCQVHAPDFRGHGQSAWAPGKYYVHDYVEDALAVLDQGNVGPAVVYGHSLGAMVGVGLAARAPHLVRALILEDPPFATMGARLLDTPLRGYFAQLRSLALRGLDVPELSAAMAEIRMPLSGSSGSVRLGDLRDEATLRFGAECLAQADPEALKPIVDGVWLRGYDARALFRRIVCPVLLLQGSGALGGMLTDEDAAALEACGNCTRILFSDAGHHIHRQQPDATVRLVRDFMESLPHLPKPVSQKPRLPSDSAAATSK